MISQFEIVTQSAEADARVEHGSRRSTRQEPRKALATPIHPPTRTIDGSLVRASVCSINEWIARGTAWCVIHSFQVDKTVFNGPFFLVD